MKKFCAIVGLCALFVTAPAYAKKKKAPVQPLPSETVAEQNGLSNVHEPEKSETHVIGINSSATVGDTSPKDAAIEEAVLKKPEVAPDAAPATPATAPTAAAPAVAPPPAAPQSIYSEGTPEFRHFMLGTIAVRFTGGYTNTRLKALNPTLHNGAGFAELSVTRELWQDVEVLAALEWMIPAHKSSLDNGGAFHIAGGARYFFSQSRLRPWAGGSLLIGTYKAWSLQSEGSTRVIYNRFGDGALIGLEPGVGLRYGLLPELELDLRLTYVGYFNNPEWRSGGASVGIGLGVAL